MRDCLHWVSVCACLWDSVLIKFIDVAHCRWVHSLGRGPGLYRSGEFKLSKGKPLTLMHSFPFALDYGCDVTGCLSSCLDCPLMMDRNPEVWRKNKLFLQKVLSVRVLYRSNRKETRSPGVPPVTLSRMPIFAPWYSCTVWTWCLCASKIQVLVGLESWLRG